MAALHSGTFHSLATGQFLLTSAGHAPCLHDEKELSLIWVCADAEQRSSHGSASFGSGANAAGAAMNSPDLSHNSVPISMPGGMPYHPSLEANSLAELLEGPQRNSSERSSYERSTSGREPGKANCLSSGFLPQWHETA